MGLRSTYLQEDFGMLACYGKAFQKHDEDCIECDLQSDCESLTKLRKERRRANVAKKPAKTKEKITVRTYESIPWRYDSSDNEEEEEETEEEEAEQEAQPNQQMWPCYQPFPPAPKSKKKEQELWAQYFYQMQQAQQMTPHYTYPYVHPIAPYYPPGVHTTSYPAQHPETHLSYIQANPIDCPMPRAIEPWWVRILKNILSGVLSESGRQAYEFFRRFRF